MFAWINSPWAWIILATLLMLGGAAVALVVALLVWKPGGPRGGV